MTSLQHTRLFGVLAHVDAGKTTVSERLLFFTGRIHRMGAVHHGNTTLDHSAEERKHGITISAAATTMHWRPDGHALHTYSLIDTPGHIDFAVEVERSLRVLDGAVVVLDASRGVEPQTESVWRQANRHGVPRVLFINKLDAPGADVDACLDDVRERLGAEVVALQHLLPDGRLLDVVELHALSFESDGTMRREQVDGFEAVRAALIEAVAQHDDELLARFVEGGVISNDELRAAVRRATLRQALVPAVCGAALKNRGVQPLLDAIAHYLPSPLDRQLPHELRADAERATCAFVFKTEVDAHVGALSWVRVFQGTIRPGDSLSVQGGRPERVGRVLGLHGATFEALTALGPGGIAALVGLKSARTGDTLCGAGLELALGRIETADPVVEFALSPRSPEEQTKLTEALRKACFVDPSLRTRVDAESGQTVLCGVGELHVAMWLERIERTEGLVVKTSAPQVAYRDTISASATLTYRHVRQSGGPGQFAVVTLRVAPRGRGQGFVFIDETRGGVIPAAYLSSIESGARLALERGVREGVPIVDVEVALLDGQTHVRDSSAVAFEVAASLGVQAAVTQAGLARLQPMAQVEVATPAEFVGAVVGELSARSGAVREVNVGTSRAAVTALVPLAKTFGLVTALRSRSEGRAQTSLQVAGYEVV